ncbi:acetyl-CoA carboxylase carboxyltransferase subunit beta [Deinococcus metallilatus]|uniref:Acetyl-coenzyme A carboxylase carboxyl transferase subunit beta n=1 Tax=Deinococcus metallilatus TaxID=1211322 RepID=A0AAJ5F2Z9_9DEIO|nr:acetyl-CoA carboxylase, carboxyltransferase subunit beta [Deinococcus metallilatus]MBB5296423.1 acetyl-CoA carboxylase carboxyl transferase subunit beta [Deinococcus metallilatus]QBY09907.1 acetyl-CoA carboxylase carboxyltransferase subunit beta [Deinococcus metallilatus]RXJ08631.1 acetyl-CoA carboxylase carboxyltransferase subunit beta [Deinococcus metallilatus]TLK25105.1 acetyl-CoA carboxylase carboxyltransferase subunit beta [Deinococcus metallilatus]GMA14664.1 acetyl-coenzyme A carboxyl
MALDRFFRRRRPQPQAGTDLPDLWTQCPQCKQGLYNRDLEASSFVCPKCGHHFRLDAGQRLDVLLDEGSFRQQSGRIHPTDPLDFQDTEPYPDRLARAQKKTGRPDAILTGTGTIEGIPVTVAAMDFAFSGGSMGSVVGEEIARAAERAAEAGTPLVLVAASGGARMQESALSLMQMAKTTVALEGLAARGLPYVSILSDPTTGGVTASFATIADVIIAEPGALIGFAGPRVIQQTIRQHLPEGFQRAEFLLSHGMVDDVVDRREHRAYLSRLLGVLTRREVSA